MRQLPCQIHDRPILLVMVYLLVFLLAVLSFLVVMHFVCTNLQTSIRRHIRCSYIFLNQDCSYWLQDKYRILLLWTYLIVLLLIFAQLDRNWGWEQSFYEVIVRNPLIFLNLEQPSKFAHLTKEVELNLILRFCNLTQ